MDKLSEFTLNTVGYDVKSLVLVMATALGAYGGFPTPPPVLQKLMSNPFLQWTLVYVLCYQGGAGQDPKLAILATITLFALHQTFSLI